MTMVDDALTNPIATVAATGNQDGASCHNASVPMMQATTAVPKAAIHLRVSRMRSSGPMIRMPA